MNRRCKLGLFTLFAALAPMTAARADDASAKKNASADPPAIRSLSFSPNGSLLAAGVISKERGGLVLVWEPTSSKLVCKYERAGESPVAVFAHDGKSLVVANGQKSLVVLDATTGMKTGELGPFPVEVTSLLSDGAGRWITLGKDGVIRVWDEKQKKVVHEFIGFKPLWAWAISPSGKWLYANGNGLDRLWDLATGNEEKGAFKPRPGSANVAAFLSEDRILLGSNSGSHRVVELPTGKELLRFKNAGGTGAVAYSPLAGILACRYYTSTSAALTPFTLRPPTNAEQNRVAELLKACDSDDYPTREKAAAALIELGPAIEPLLKAVMTEDSSAEVRMRARVARDNVLNKPKFELKGHADEIRPMVFAPDGKLLATGGADGLVILWDPGTGKEVARLTVSAD